MGTGHAGSVFGDNSFYRETWVQDDRGRHVAKRSSDPQRARGVNIRGKFVLSRNLGYKMRGRHIPAAVRHGRARQSSWTGRCGDGSCGYRSRGVSIRG